MRLNIEVIKKFTFCGKKTSVSIKLMEGLELLGCVEFIDVDKIDYDLFNSRPKFDQFVVINLLDGEQEAIVLYLKSHFSDILIIAIHCYTLKSMIDSTLSKGYHAYIPIFKFAREIEVVIEKLTDHTDKSIK